MKIICDIDGTVADGSARDHFVTSNPKNWAAYYNLVHTDTPIQPVIDLITALHFSAGADIVFVSGRNGDVREQTLEWLNTHMKGMPIDLRMRESGDFRADDIIKEEILDQLITEGFNPDIIIDDRKRVVDMWRRRGYCTLQPREGDF